MAGQNQKRRGRARPESRARGGEQPSRERRREEHARRLRGDEFADDFVDAEADSCVSVHRRNEKESES